MRAGWEDFTLGEICSKYNGLIQTGPFGAQLHEKEYDTKGEYHVIMPKDIEGNSINISRTAKINSSTFNKLKRYEVAINDIIYPRRGDISKRAFIKEKIKGICGTGCLRVRINSDLISIKYLNYYLSLDKSINWLNSNSVGATMKNLNTKILSNLPILLPALETQKKIASILSGYDDLIENNLKRIKILEEMAQQTYEEWFVRMRFPGHETAVMNDDTGLPEGWEKVKLGEMCNITMGQSPKSEYYNDTGDGLPFHQGVKDYGFRFPINKSWSTQGNKVAKAGSVLFSVRAPVGRINVASEEIILGRGLAAISHKKGLNSFLLYQLKNIFFEDNMIGGGAIYASVTKNDMERIEVIFCDNYAQKFNSYAQNIDQSILNLTLQNQRLREARDLLLPRLMMGMVEV